MTYQNLAVVVILATFQAVCGWLFVFKTDMLVRWGLSNYARSKMLQGVPNTGLILKSWYPTLLRGAGIFIWLFDAGFICIAILAATKR